MLDKTKEQPTEQEVFEWLKRGATLNAVHMLITYKIVGMIEKKDFKPVYIMQGDDLETIIENSSTDWRRIEKEYNISEMKEDVKFSHLLKSDYKKMQELYSSFNVAYETKEFEDYKYSKRISLTFKNENLEIWFNQFEEFVSQEIVEKIV